MPRLIQVLEEFQTNDPNITVLISYDRYDEYTPFNVHAFNDAKQEKKYGSFHSTINGARDKSALVIQTVNRRFKR